MDDQQIWRNSCKGLPNTRSEFQVGNIRNKHQLLLQFFNTAEMHLWKMPLASNQLDSRDTSIVKSLQKKTTSSQLIVDATFTG
jgi:hypothetical protein